jgi:hypothetical protein
MPIPLTNALNGEDLPYARGATRVVDVEIVSRDGMLTALEIWDNGERTPAEWGNGGDPEHAWEDVLLGDGRTRYERTQAFAALKAIWAEQDYWLRMEG